MALKTNNISFDSFFSERIIDNNGVSVTDINAGLINLFGNLKANANGMQEEQLYLSSEYEVGYPDLIARNSVLGDQRYWWWVLVLNGLEDPFTEIVENWIYPIYSAADINTFIEKSNASNTSKNNDRIGTIVELN